MNTHITTARTCMAILKLAGGRAAQLDEKYQGTDIRLLDRIYAECIDALNHVSEQDQVILLAELDEEEDQYPDGYWMEEEMAEANGR